jgi:hypothetical protein
MPLGLEYGTDLVRKSARIHNREQNHRCCECNRSFEKIRGQKQSTEAAKLLIDNLLLQKTELYEIAPIRVTEYACRFIPIPHIRAAAGNQAAFWLHDTYFDGTCKDYLPQTESGVWRSVRTGNTPKRTHRTARGLLTGTGDESVTVSRDVQRGKAGVDGNGGPGDCVHGLKCAERAGEQMQSPAEPLTHSRTHALRRSPASAPAARARRRRR